MPTTVTDKAKESAGLPELLTPRQVAQLLQVHESTLRRWRAAGQFPKPIRLGRRAVRYRSSDIIAWMEPDA